MGACCFCIANLKGSPRGELPRKRVRGGPMAQIRHPATLQSPSVTAPLKGNLSAITTSSPAVQLRSNQDIIEVEHPFPQ